MSIYKPDEGIKRFLDTLKGIRRYDPSTPLEEMEESPFTYQELIFAIARRDLQHLPLTENIGRATHAIRIRNHPAKIFLIIDTSNFTISVLLKSEKTPEKKRIKGIPENAEFSEVGGNSEEKRRRNEAERKQTRRFRKLLETMRNTMRNKVSWLF